MKVSKAYFKRFKDEFVRLQRLLGLTQYRIDFFHESLRSDDGSTAYAKAQIYEQDKFAKIFLTTEIIDSSIDEGPESHARHEVFHLLIHRLSWLAESRFAVNQSDIDEEAESIVVRLEKVI